MWLERDPAVIRTVIEHNAANAGDRPAIHFEDGRTWTSSRLRDEVYVAANALAGSGVVQGGRVAMMLPNGPDLIRAWLGARCLGAAIMPLNPALKGRMLTHPLNLADPDVIVSTPRQMAGLAAELAGHPVLDVALLRDGSRDEPPLRRSIELDDPEVILMTSGTTGPSKVWSSTVAQASTTGAYVRDGDLGTDDRFLIDLPLFHTAGLGVTSGCLRSGTLAVIRARPSLSRYFEIARDLDITACFLVGSMAAKLLAMPESPRDRDHRVRLAVAAPLPPDLPRFVERFGIKRVVTSFGSTETGGPIGTGNSGVLPAPGSTGRARPGWGDYKIVDGAGAEVETGVVGELLLRPALPAARAGHYLKDPEATATVWAGGWFHTGDLLRRDADGDFFFVGRDRDTIRRRGENISSFEVEREVLQEPGVAEAACVAVEPADDVGVEVKVWIVPQPDAGELDLAAMVARLADRMPAHMVPRYVEIVAELPMTPTQRVMKYVLRDRGNSAATWDRLAVSPSSGVSNDV